MSSSIRIVDPALLPKHLQAIRDADDVEDIVLEFGLDDLYLMMGLAEEFATRTLEFKDPHGVMHRFTANDIWDLWQSLYAPMTKLHDALWDSTTNRND